MIDFFDRYADRIQRSNPDSCWLWTGAVAAGGYGHTHRDGHHVYAHRAAYESRAGVGSAKGLVVRHKCDTPGCCNPDHLELGTHADNAADMIARGRNNPVQGEKVNTARLSREEVVAARDMARRGVRISVIRTKVTPVTHWTLSLAIRGKTWASVPGAVDLPNQRGRA